MVPAGADGLTICSQRGGTSNGPAHTKNKVVKFSNLVRLLNSGSMDHETSRCDAGGLARTFTLVFTYATGPAVAVAITPDCEPSITNGNVRANNTPAVLAAITQLTGLR